MSGKVDLRTCKKGDILIGSHGAKLKYICPTPWGSFTYLDHVVEYIEMKDGTKPKDAYGLNNYGTRTHDGFVFAHNRDPEIDEDIIEIIPVDEPEIDEKLLAIMLNRRENYGGGIKTEALVLLPSDLRKEFRKLPIDKVEFVHFMLSKQQFAEGNLFLYIDEFGTTKILKNRWGNHGIVK